MVASLFGFPAPLSDAEVVVMPDAAVVVAVGAAASAALVAHRTEATAATRNTHGRRRADRAYAPRPCPKLVTAGEQANTPS